MQKKSFVLLTALLTSASMAIAAGNSENSKGVGPDPKHVSGATAKHAGPTGSGGTGASATGSPQGGKNGASNAATAKGGKSGGTAGKQGDSSGAAYIDCPGNAFSGGSRGATKATGNDCVPPESVVIRGSDRLNRDNDTSGQAVGDTSGVGSTGQAGNGATSNSGGQSQKGGGTTSSKAGNSASKKDRTPAEKVEQGGSSLR